MKNFNQQGGFTLVEVLVAIAVLMIVIFSFTLLFTSSFTWIFNAGDKGEALFKAQELMENKIAEGPNGSGGEPLSISFGEKQILITGETKVIEHQYDDRNITLYYFYPGQ